MHGSFRENVAILVYWLNGLLVGSGRGKNSINRYPKKGNTRGRIKLNTEVRSYGYEPVGIIIRGSRSETTGDAV
jgi:hypothetical protein